MLIKVGTSETRIAKRYDVYKVGDTIITYGRDEDYLILDFKRVFHGHGYFYLGTTTFYYNSLRKRNVWKFSTKVECSSR